MATQELPFSGTTRSTFCSTCNHLQRLQPVDTVAILRKIADVCSAVSCMHARLSASCSSLQATRLWVSLVKTLLKALQEEQVAGVILAQRPLDGLLDSVHLRFVFRILSSFLIQSLLCSCGSLKGCSRRAGSLRIPVCRRSHGGVGFRFDNNTRHRRRDALTQRLIPWSQTVEKCIRTAAAVRWSMEVAQRAMLEVW